MSIIELPIYETFPGYHSIITKKKKDIEQCLLMWENCPTDSMQSIYNFLHTEYHNNQYLVPLIDSLSHIKETSISRWKSFIYDGLIKEKETLDSYTKQDSIDTKHIITFLEDCGVRMSSKQNNSLSDLMTRIQKECTYDCLPYLCIALTETDIVVSSCIIYRYAFKQSIELTHLCGNLDILFKLMLQQPEYYQLSIYCTYTYEVSHSNDELLSTISTIMSYDFHMKKAVPYSFLFIRSPHQYFPLDKQGISSILQSSFKIESSMFITDSHTFIQYKDHQQLQSFFSILFYLMFKGDIIHALQDISLKLVCICHKLKTRQSRCSYFDLFLFLLHVPTYCSVLFYNMTTLFLIPPLIQNTAHIDGIIKKMVKQSYNVNISYIGTIQPLIHYCVHSDLFSASCSQIDRNIFQFRSIQFSPLRKLDFIHVNSLLQSFMKTQIVTDCTQALSFFPHQLETIYNQSSMHFLQLHSDSVNMIATYDSTNDNPSPIIYYYIENDLPNKDDIQKCIELFSQSFGTIMCIVVVTKCYYFFIQCKQTLSHSYTDILERYNVLIDKYGISLEGKLKCQESVCKHFTNEWNQIEPFYIHSFVRETSKLNWKINIDLVSCKKSSKGKEEDTEEEDIGTQSIFSSIGPFYQLDAPRLHKCNEDVFIYEEDNIEDINEQIAETQYENALLFEEFNRYGIPEQEYEPELKQDLNKEEYYDSVLKNESYDLFLEKQYEDESLNVLQEDAKETVGTQQVEYGRDVVNQVKDMLSSQDELANSEDYLLLIDSHTSEE